MLRRARLELTGARAGATPVDVYGTAWGQVLEGVDHETLAVNGEPTIEIPDGTAKAISPEGYRTFSRSVSPDGTRVVAGGPDRRRYFYPVAGGEPTPISGLAADETPGGWTSDGRFLYVYRRRDLPGRVYRFEIATGKKELAREVMPADGSGIVDIAPIILTPDGKNYVYGFQRTLSDIYILAGVK